MNWIGPFHHPDILKMLIAEIRERVPMHKGATIALRTLPDDGLCGVIDGQLYVSRDIIDEFKAYAEKTCIPEHN